MISKMSYKQFQDRCLEHGGVLRLGTAQRQWVYLIVQFKGPDGNCELVWEKDLDRKDG